MNDALLLPAKPRITAKIITGKSTCTMAKKTGREIIRCETLRATLARRLHYLSDGTDTKRTVGEKNFEL